MYFQSHYVSVSLRSVNGPRVLRKTERSWKGDNDRMLHRTKSTGFASVAFIASRRRVFAIVQTVTPSSKCEILALQAKVLITQVRSRLGS